MISRSVLLRMRNVSDKIVDKVKTHVLCSVIFCRKSCRLWDNVENVVEPDRPQTTAWHMRFACCITEATNTHSEYVILFAFPRQQWLHRSHTYIVRLVRVQKSRFLVTRCLFLAHRPIVELVTDDTDLENKTSNKQLISHNMIWFPDVKIILGYRFVLGTTVAQWLRCCATNRKVACSIPAGVIRIFH
jgi:hypothetical protein